MPAPTLARSEEALVLAPAKVPMYRFDLDHVNGPGCKLRLTEPWHHWGWCRPEDVLQILNINYQFEWGLMDLFDRFLPVGIPRIDSQGHGLAILTPMELEHNVRRRYLMSNDRFFLKAGVFLPVSWGNDLLRNISDGARRYYLANRVVMVGFEDGNSDRAL
jgi:hypothetical protein